MGNIIETDVNKSDEYKGRSVKEKKKGREILIALVFMFLFLMFSGCIFRSEANLGSTMLLRGIEQQDIDQDGKTDIYIATFSDSKINAGNATIFLTRSIYAYPTQIVINPKTFIVDSAELNFIKESSIKINEDIVKADASCRAVFEPALCNDKQSCENSCLTRDCKEKGYGLLLLDYTDLMRKRDEQLRALLLLAQTLREGDSVKEISSRLTQLNVIIKSIENHPLIKETGLCKFSYDLSNVSKYMGTFSPLQNNVIIVNSILAQQTTGINTELSITETINGNIDKNVQNYKLPDEITRTGISPTVLKFNDIRISKDQKFYIIYIANANANEIIPYDSWNNIKAEVKVIIFDISTISSSINSLNALYAPIYQLTGITKLSLGLSLFILIAVLILIIELSSYILRFISLLRSRKPLTYSLRRAFGFSSLTWKTDIIIGVILLILSYVVDSYVTIPLSLPALSIEQLSEAITKDPLIAIAVAGYAGSFVFLFFAFIDRFKRLLSGKEYDEAVEIPTAERNIKNWQVLKDKIEETKKLLEQAAEMEMDVGQQMSQILSIPLDSLRNDIYSNPNQKEVKDRIIGHINNVEAIKASVMQKMELAKQKRAEWLNYIDQKLEKTDMLPLDALVTIPNEWRFWAAKEYIKEHPEKFSSIEGVMLVKKKLTEEEKAQKFLLRLLQGKEDKIKCLLIVKEKKILSAIIKEKRESLIKNLGLLINEEMSLFNAQSFFAEGDKLSMGIKTLSDKKLIVLAEKDVIDEILSNAEKLEKMLE